MKRISTLDIPCRTGFSYGKGSSLSNSWIETSDTSQFVCGHDCKFISAKITVKEGGRLTIGDRCIIRGRIIVEADSVVAIGHGLICNFDIKVQSADGSSINIGNDCLFSNVGIYNSDMHSIFDMASGDRINASKNVHIGDRVWMAQEVLILKGAYIDHDTVIGARAVVSGRHASHVVLAGSPAKAVRSGICWSRHSMDRKPIALPDNFSMSEFVSLATRHENHEVIRKGAHLLGRYEECDITTLPIFYYTARAIYLLYFDKNEKVEAEVMGQTISLPFLADVFLHTFHVSGGKNHPLGSFAYRALCKLGRHAEAQVLYERILPDWPAIAAMKGH